MGMRIGMVFLIVLRGCFGGGARGRGLMLGNCSEWTVTMLEENC